MNDFMICLNTKYIDVRYLPTGVLRSGKHGTGHTRSVSTQVPKAGSFSVW